jgi:hypothetical protein
MEHPNSHPSTEAYKSPTQTPESNTRRPRSRYSPTRHSPPILMHHRARGASQISQKQIPPSLPPIHPQQIPHSMLEPRSLKPKKGSVTDGQTGVPNLDRGGGRCAWTLARRLSRAAGGVGDEAEGAVPSFAGAAWRGVAWRSGGFLAGFGSKSNSEGMGEGEVAGSKRLGGGFVLKLRGCLPACLPQSPVRRSPPVQLQCNARASHQQHVRTASTLICGV